MGILRVSKWVVSTRPSADRPPLVSIKNNSTRHRWVRKQVVRHFRPKEALLFPTVSRSAIKNMESVPRKSNCRRAISIVRALGGYRRESANRRTESRLRKPCALGCACPRDLQRIGRDRRATVQTRQVWEQGQSC